MPSAKHLRDDALAIWQAGVDAVNSSLLVRNAVRVENDSLQIANHSFAANEIDRIVVVGAGKAAAGMAVGFEAAVESLPISMEGLVNVPADCVRELRSIETHPARPAGRNEPTAAGVIGTQRMLDQIGSAGPRSLVVVLLSGGGSALLPLPVDGVSLAEKQSVTRLLSESGADIRELNTVRQHLSQVKGGGLATSIRQVGTEHAICLVISDVIGDPLEFIASGPTVRPTTTAHDAIAVLERYDPTRLVVSDGVWKALETATSEARDEIPTTIIGNNATALRACAWEAERRGYRVLCDEKPYSGEARNLGEQFLHRARGDFDKPTCLLAGGEPTVTLAATSRPRKGGRNQELALAALNAARSDGLDGIAIVAGGTDGEDGPTDAAGAIADAVSLDTAKNEQLDPNDYLAINNAYEFFSRIGGLIQTGPTHTNVMDVCVVLITR